MHYLIRHTSKHHGYYGSYIAKEGYRTPHTWDLISARVFKTYEEAAALVRLDREAIINDPLYTG